MSRLSLKPGGEPGKWELSWDARWEFQASIENADHRIAFLEVEDSDLRDIRHTINEYLDTKDFLFSDVPVAKPSLWKRLRVPLTWVTLGWAMALTGFWYGWSRVPTISPSTGGVIDQLCMRPDIECSTSIRYVHPQAGVPHQERETYSADSLSQAHLEEQ